MFDVKQWLQPHSHELHRHVQPHCFKFVRNENGEAVMFYRKWSGNAWLGPVRVIKVEYHKRLTEPRLSLIHTFYRFKIQKLMRR